MTAGVMAGSLFDCVEFGFDVGEGGLKCGAAVRVGGALREDVFALEFESLAVALALRVGGAYLSCCLVGVF